MRFIYSALFTVSLLVTVPVILLESERAGLAQTELTEVAPLTMQGELGRDSEVMKDGSYFNRHTFTGRAGQQVVIDLVSDAFDTYLILQDPNGQKIAENNDGDGSNARLVVTLPLNGTYTLLANSYVADATGAYELSIRAATDRDIALQAANEQFQEGMKRFNAQDYQAALPLFEQALEAYRRLEERVREARALHRIGWIYNNLGQYEQALDYYQQALSIRQAVKDRAGEDATLHNIGLVYRKLGQYDQALDYYQQALSISQEVKDRAGEGTTLNNIGAVYNALGQYDQALDYYQQALSINQAVKNRAGEGSTLHNIGLVYRNLGQYDQALAYYQQALSINQAVKNRAGEGTTLNNIGVVYDNLGQYEQALDYYQQALSIRQEVKDRAGEGSTLNNIGYVLETQQQKELAIVFLKQSVNTYETIRADLRSLPIEQQQSYTETVAHTYRKLADLLLQQNRILEAQRVLDLLKVQELDDYLRDVRGNEQTASGVEYWQPEQRILDLYAQVIAEGTELLQLEEKDRTTRLTPAEEQRYNELLARQNDLLSNFSRFTDDPIVQTALQQLRQSTEGQNVELADFTALQRNLGDLQQDAVLLYPLILEDRLELVLVTPYSPPIRRPVPVNSTDLNRAIVQLGQALKNPAIDAKPAAQQLYEWLIKPLEAELKAANTRTIIYAPDGPLRYIPLAALYDGQSWLTQRFAFSQITAASLTNFAARPDPSLRVLAGACAECSFDFTVGNQPFRFNDLPYTEAEVKNLSTLIPGTSPLLNQAFNPTEIVNNLRRYSVIHLATHAAFVQKNGDESFIVFGNGTKVTLAEIKQNWNLRNTDLIVLSACETAVGETELGSGVEILGFGYQMQQAGARSAIASLWAVNDNSTQVLMNAFYTALKQGMTKAEALQAAQRTLLEGQITGPDDSTRSDIEARPDGRVAVVPQEGAIPPGYAHPYHWAPFILIGNGL